MKIIKKRENVVKVDYSIDFTDDSGGGFSFTCDKDGKVNLSECAQKNYLDCLAGCYPTLTNRGVCENVFSYTEPAVGICDFCKCEVILDGHYQGASECECGQWYSIGGERLVHPDYWEQDSDY